MNIINKLRKLGKYKFKVPDIIVKNLQKLKIKKASLYLNIGAFFMRRGVLIVPGQQIVLQKGKGPSLRGNRTVNRRKNEVVFVENITYDFVHNRIRPKYCNKLPLWMKNNAVDENK